MHDVNRMGPFWAETEENTEDYIGTEENTADYTDTGDNENIVTVELGMHCAVEFDMHYNTEFIGGFITYFNGEFGGELWQFRGYSQQW